MNAKSADRATSRCVSDVAGCEARECLVCFEVRPALRRPQTPAYAQLYGRLRAAFPRCCAGFGRGGRQRRCERHRRSADALLWPRHVCRLPAWLCQGACVQRRGGVGKWLGWDALTDPGLCLQHSTMDGLLALTCPDQGCDGRFTLAAMKAALADDERALRRFWDLRALSLMRKPLHCPYKDCSALMDAQDMDVSAPTPCGSCHRELCIGCAVPFHSGLSCEQFQALPPKLRSKEDIELLQLAHAERWRRCPACRHFVERLPGGCNFMKCRCSHAFCYACGVPYVHTRRTANNAHGQPGCQCGLFAPPPPEQAEPAAAVMAFANPLRVRAPPPQQHIVSLRKGRAQLRDGRRWVKRNTQRSIDPTWVPAGPQRCSHSRAHAGCPHGVCCWFLHAHDDM